MTDTITGGTEAERAAIEQLYAAHGHLTPTVVLDAASDPSSPLHNQFTWDDTDAAHKFRLQQAGHLIRKFRIVRPTTDGRTVRVPQFTRIEHNYIDTREVVTQEQLRDRTRLRIITSMERLREDLTQFEEFADIATAIDGVLA